MPIPSLLGAKVQQLHADLLPPMAQAAARRSITPVNPPMIAPTITLANNVYPISILSKSGGIPVHPVLSNAASPTINHRKADRPIPCHIPAAG